ncbi:MAG: phosphoglycerate kinase [Deltaproteobacteria bacterium]|nr:MAG: phosphoglycerate kinase [Deltaproteobacteria bacterium]
MRFIDTVAITGKRLLIRVDYNVPMEGGVIKDDNRIRASLPTLQWALDKGCALVLCSHLGKPKGKVEPGLSLAPVARHLAGLLGREVLMAPDCIGDATKAMIEGLQPGQILMLENLRFHAGEKKNDPDFCKALAAGVQGYVNDAFGVSHRAHGSVVGVLDHIALCCGGLLLKKEWEYLGEALKAPTHPFVAIIGGAKVSSKLGILYALLDKVDRILIGGAMANTFLKAQGYEVGRSLVEDDLLDQALSIMAKANDKGVSLYLPVDCILGDGPKGEVTQGVCPYQDVPKDEMILDIGPATSALFAEGIRDAATLVWNGPMGAFENKAFSQGSFNLAMGVAQSEALTIVGGGDTDAIIHTLNIQDRISFISTGGGSFLEFLEGKELPGFKALLDKEKI